MNALKLTALRAGLAVTATVLTLGVSINWAPDATHGYYPGSLHIALVTLAYADDDDDGGDGGGGDDGGDGGGDDGGSDDGGGDDDAASSEDAERDEADDTDEADEEEEEEGEAEEEAAGYGDIAVTTDGRDDHVRSQVIGVAVTAAGRRTIERLGAEVVDTTDYPALGITVTRVSAAIGPSAKRLQELLNESDTGLYSLNHVYRLAAAGNGTSGPLALLGWAGRPQWCGADVRIGIIDTAVDLSQLGGRAQQVRMRRFAPGPSRTNRHGTAIASLLLGTPPAGPPGALPAARLLVADVYRVDERGNPLTLTTDLIAALNWLVGQGVEVINMSLAGPPDRVLRRALRRVKKQGRVVVAAAGNRGPLAPPAYPAAYSGVIAVTAVNRQLEVFAHANRGDYIDIAAPGVGLLVPPGRRASGTSLAAVYVSAALAEAASDGANVWHAAQQLLAGARDLGPAGSDPIFGHGLLSKPISCER